MSLKNINKAIQDLGDALFYDPHNPEVHYHIGLACLKSKDFEGSTKFFTNCIHYDPGNTFAYSNLAYTYNWLGLYSKSIETWEKADKYADQNSPAFYNLIKNWTYSLIKDKYFLDAIINIRRGLQMNPMDAEMWVMWGTIQKI